MSCSVIILRGMEQAEEPKAEKCLFCGRVKTAKHVTFFPQPKNLNRKKKIVCLDVLALEMGEKMQTRVVIEKEVYE